MELIGKLKEKVAKAKTNDEKKKLIEEAGIRLNTEELEKIGGVLPPISNNSSEAGIRLNSDELEKIGGVEPAPTTSDSCESKAGLNPDDLEKIGGGVSVFDQFIR